jgi:anti-sigma regulatory factor (Ser/Thr protein kinase)
MWTAQQQYPCSVASVRDARTFCTEQLNDLLGETSHAQDVVDAANLIVSELITNAVNACCSSSNLTLTCEGDSLRISVLDDGAGTPLLTAAAERDEHGRGLAIIDALAASWGVVEYEDDGKQVWAELTMPPV